MIRICRHKSQMGASLVFIALCLPLLILFLAYVVETNLSSSSHEQADHFARYAALAAMEGFFETKCAPGLSCCYSARRQAALERANQILRNNYLLGRNATHSMEVVWGPGSTDTSGKPHLEPGNWYYTMPQSGDPCSGDYPCFIENESGTECTSINAFRITGSFGGAYQSRFAKILMGTTSLPLGVQVVATLVPRHACFLVDTSASATRETHLSTGPNRSEFGFYLASDNPGAVGHHDTVWNALGATRPPADPNTPAPSHHSLQRRLQKKEASG